MKPSASTLSRLGVRAAAITACAMLAGCMSTMERAHFEELDSQATFERLVTGSEHGTADDQSVLELGPEVLELTGRLRAEAGSPRRRVTALAELFRPGHGLDLQFENLGAYTAMQTFEQRAGNCLSYTHLFIAMARELGLEARYREVFDAHRWEELGDFALLNRHVVAYGELGSSYSYQADFGYVDWLDDRFGTLISDERARAMHFNNLGALAMTEGDEVAAVRYFNRGLLIDRDVSYLWANLGTAYARLGDAERAELAYRQALRVDPYDAIAVSQMARLYERLDEPRLAAFYHDRRERLRTQNPYRRFHDGVAAMDAGEFEQAVPLLRQAARMQPNQLHFRLELGKALAMMGDMRRARREFNTAADLVMRIEDRYAFEDALDYVRRMAGTAERDVPTWVDLRDAGAGLY